VTSSADFTRRDALRALIGVPLLSQACRRSRGREYPGGLRGASIELGHRLRDATHDATIERASGPRVRVQVAIVGAGPSGLSAAWRLRQLGCEDFKIFDIERMSGGTSAYGTDGVVPYPWGAHYVPVPARENRALVRLLDELGVLERDKNGEPVGKERFLVRAPEERVFSGGVWHEGLFPKGPASPRDFAELERFEREIARLSAYRDARGRRAFGLPTAACSDDAELTVLDRISAERWLDERGFRAPWLRWYVEYACRDDYGLSLARTSAWAMLFYFASRRSPDSGKTAPFLTWPEGNGRLVAHLSAPLGTRLELGRLVTDVVPGETSVELAVFDAHERRLSRVSAEFVVLAVPAFVARRILRPYRDAPPEHLSAFRYSAWLVANLHLSARPKNAGFEPAWDNVLRDSPGLGYVAATHQQLADEGPTIWTYYRPFTGPDLRREREALAALDHRAAAELVLADLGRAHDDLEPLITRLDVWRWGHAMIAPVPGFIWGPARRRALEPHGRVHFAHSDLSGLALFEEAQQRGIAAAEAVMRQAGRDVAAL
jgi:protoporphyrinogen oxidase